MGRRVDSVVELALARRAQIMREIASLDAFIVAAGNIEADRPVGMPVIRARASVKQAVSEACRELIEQRGPLSLDFLYRTLLAHGISAGSKNPKGMLSIILSRSKEFKSEDRLWRIVDTETGHSKS